MRNETIKWDLNILSINDNIEENETKLKDYVNRMIESRPPKKIMNYLEDLDRPHRRMIIDTGKGDVT